MSSSQPHRHQGGGGSGQGSGSGHPPRPSSSSATPSRGQTRHLIPPEQQQLQQQYQQQQMQQQQYLNTGSLDRRQRRRSGGTTPQGHHPSGMGASRMSPGPSIYRTMPLNSGQPVSGRTTPGGGGVTPGGRHTPSHMIRPIPQHLGAPGTPGMMRGYSPITVPKVNQSPVRITFTAEPNTLRILISLNYFRPWARCLFRQSPSSRDIRPTSRCTTIRLAVSPCPARSARPRPRSWPTKAKITSTNSWQSSRTRYTNYKVGQTIPDEIVNRPKLLWIAKAYLTVNNRLKSITANIRDRWVSKNFKLPPYLSIQTTFKFQL